MEIVKTTPLAHRSQKIATLALSAALVSLALTTASAALDAPSLALRMVDGKVQVGTESAASYYLQWCTPMGTWSNWNENTQIDPDTASLWFRGIFDDAEADSMQWDPPANVALYSADSATEGPDGFPWISIGQLDEEGLIQSIPRPDLMARQLNAADPVAYADPKNNQAVATPDPGLVKLYWRNRVSNLPVIWHLSDTGVRKSGVSVATAPSKYWILVDTADIDGDGTTDLVWHNSSTGRIVIWFLDPDGVLNHSQLVRDVDLSTSWSIQGVADLNHDGVPDLIFHHATTGRATIWYLKNDGTYLRGSYVLDANVATTWKIVGVADMNKDSNPDLIWLNSSTGIALIWFLDAEGLYVSGANVADVKLSTAWKIVGVADMNKDANPDLIWHHATTGRAHIWFLDGGGRYVSGANVADVNLATAWKVAGVEDVNNDGEPDLIWHNSSTGRAHTWFLDDTGLYARGTNALDVNLATTWGMDSVAK